MKTLLVLGLAGLAFGAVGVVLLVRWRIRHHSKYIWEADLGFSMLVIGAVLMAVAIGYD